MWSILTPADIEAHLNAAELAEYRSHAAQIDDPLPTILADVIAHVRGRIAVRYTLEEEGIPEALRIAAIDLVIYRLANRVKKTTDDDGNRHKAAESAEEILRDVAQGRFSLPITPVAAGRWGSTTKFTA